MIRKLTILSLSFVLFSCFNEPKKEIEKNDNNNIHRATSNLKEEVKANVLTDSSINEIQKNNTLKNEYGQSFLLSELINLNKLDFNSFDTTVQKKGYIFYENVVDDFSDSNSYTFLSNGVRISFISKITYNNKNMISYQTKDNETYIKIKEDLVELEFNFINKKVVDNSTILTYTKKNIELTLISGINTNSNGYKNPNYEISITE